MYSTTNTYNNPNWASHYTQGASSFANTYNTRNNSNYQDGQYSPYANSNVNTTGSPFNSSIANTGTFSMGLTQNSNQTANPGLLLSIDQGIDSSVANINNMLGMVGLSGVTPTNLTNTDMANYNSLFSGMMLGMSPTGITSGAMPASPFTGNLGNLNPGNLNPGNLNLGNLGLGNLNLNNSGLRNSGVSSQGTGTSSTSSMDQMKSMMAMILSMLKAYINQHGNQAAATTQSASKTSSKKDTD